MKKNQLLVPFMVVLFAAFLVSCEDEIVDPKEKQSEKIASDDFYRYSTAQMNDALNELAVVIAKTVENGEFRRVLKREAVKKYNGQYDVPFNYFLDQTVSEMKSTGVNTINDLIENDFNNLKSLSENEKDSNFKDTWRKIPNLKISVPVKCDEWDIDDFNPLVAVMKVDNDKDKEEYINAYDSEGDQVMLDAKNEPDFPVIVIGICNRLDESGKVMYDRTNFQVHDSLRIDAYEMISCQQLKSEQIYDFIQVHPSLCNLFEKEEDLSSTEEINDTLLCEEIKCYVESQGFIEDQTNKKVNKSLNTNVPSKPYDLQVYNYTATKALDVRWKHDDSNCVYELQYSRHPNYNNWITVSSNIVGYDYVHYGLSENNYYRYRVRAKNTTNNTYGSYSYIEEGKPSLRERLGKEGIAGMYFEQDYFDSFDTWYQGSEPEFGIRLYRSNIDKVTNEIISVGFQTVFHYAVLSPQDLNPFKNGYCPIYDQWDPKEDNSSYNIWVYEDDGIRPWVSKQDVELGGELNYSDKEGASLKLNGTVNFSIEWRRSFEHVLFHRVTWQDCNWILSGQVPSKMKLRLLHIPYNRSEKCPYVGSFDGANCLVANPGAGTNPRIINGYYVYETANTCLPGFNSIPLGNNYRLCYMPIDPNCSYDAQVVGPIPFVYHNRFYVTPGY
ncbi:MAG: DUF3103 family protein [Prolixibacteraceae bacterium]|jgi:hypothetical protein|nr:DUF3103 family protein [Prolixibacteraceae bacterium]